MVQRGKKLTTGFVYWSKDFKSKRKKMILDGKSWFVAFLPSLTQLLRLLIQRGKRCYSDTKQLQCRGLLRPMWAQRPFRHCVSERLSGRLPSALRTEEAFWLLDGRESDHRRYAPNQVVQPMAALRSSWVASSRKWMWAPRINWCTT